MFKAVKNSPTLKEKSEFETTAAFQVRRSRFADEPLIGDLKPTGLLAFLVEDSALATHFMYDADAQTLAATITGRTMRFIMDADKATLDGVLVRNVTRSRDTYIGGNAFGANVKVDRTFIEEFGLAFEQGGWLFREPARSPREFTYLLAMDAKEAERTKADLRLVFVCRLVAPWIRKGAHGHDATVSEPYEMVIRENYLQVVPEQLWVVNARTGDVIRKITSACARGASLCD